MPLGNTHCNLQLVSCSIGSYPAHCSPVSIDETKNVRIVFVVSHETRRELEALAKKDRRPLGAFVRNICEDRIAAEKEN